MDATQPYISQTSAPCPDCGSTDVRWRPRRFYDVVFTYVRWFVDSIAGALFRSTRSTVAGSGFSDRTNEGRLAAVEYAEERKLYEDRIGTKTASRFWKCRSCGHRGQVFDNLDNVVAERQRLAGFEDTISGSVGSVNEPLKNEPPKD